MATPKKTIAEQVKEIEDTIKVLQKKKDSLKDKLIIEQLQKDPLIKKKIEDIKNPPKSKKDTEKV